MAAAVPAGNYEGAGMLVVLTRGEGRKQKQEQQWQNRSSTSRPLHLSSRPSVAVRRLFDDSLKFKMKMKKIQMSNPQICHRTSHIVTSLFGDCDYFWLKKRLKVCIYIIYWAEVIIL